MPNHDLAIIVHPQFTANPLSMEKRFYTTSGKFMIDRHADLNSPFLCDVGLIAQILDRPDIISSVCAYLSTRTARLVSALDRHNGPARETKFGPPIPSSVNFTWRLRAWT